VKARDVLAAMAGRSARRRNLILMGATLALAIAAAIGSGASSAAAEEGCPNEAIRIRQHATQLADCRAWERVSPADKGDGDLIAEGESTKASANGGAAVFESRLLFGDAIGSGTVGRTTYVARRSAGGWTTHSVTPMPNPETVQVLFASNRAEIFAEDLNNAFWWAYDLPAVADDEPRRENLYSQDTVTGTLRTVSKTQVDPLDLFEFLNTQFSGYSDDGKHLAFETVPTPFGPPPRLLPDAAPEVPNVYKWDDGVLSLAGILPDGTVPTAGSTISPEKIKGTMSADGSRLVFNASPDGSAPSQLYLHVDGKPSVWVSEPELSSGDETPVNGVQFEGMTPDGNNIFFKSDEPLVDGDTAPGPDEYRFTYGSHPASESGNLTLITNNGGASYDPFGLGGTLVGMSDDGKRVYLHPTGQGLVLWQEGVSGLKTVDPSVDRPAPGAWLTLVGAEPGFGRVSPDGNWVAYLNKDKMYLYDRRSEALTCVSCPSVAAVDPKITNTGGRNLIGFRPRFLADDGKVFFSSTASLVPEDTNGVADVYAFDGQTGALSLLSSGKGSDPTMFADASRSGDDVFIYTRQQLVPSDRDEYVDLYDVRVGGGFDEAEGVSVAPCSGEACQGGPAASPGSPPIGSRAAGRGNLRPTHCGKGRHKIRRKGKARCVRMHHGHHHRHARTDRGGAK
jgi:Tol biopolymer transport system component